MKSKLFSYKSLFLIIGLWIFGYLVYDFGFDNIVENLRKTGWWFLAIISTWLFVYLLNAAAWINIINLKEKIVGFSKIFKVTVSGFAINYITPFISLGGEPYRIMAFKNDIGTRNATSTVILYTMLHMFSHFWFWITGIILLALFYDMSTTIDILVMISFVVIIGLIWLFLNMYRKGFVVTLSKFVRKLPFMKNVYKRIQEKEDSIDDVDKIIRNFYNNNKPAFFRALFFEYTARVVSALEFLFILKAIGIEISFTDAIYIHAASSLIMNLVFFMPFQLGSREGGLYLIFQSLSLGAGIGIYTALVTRLREFFWIFTGLVLISFTDKGNSEDKKKVIDYLKRDHAD